MSVKKLINSTDGCVDESLRGFCRSYPGLYIYDGRRIILDRVPNKNRKIALLSGGGSGHEPFPSGYVGRGMLTASVSGSIFTSPPHGQILHAIRRLSTEHEGVLLVVPNYSGDVLNFGLAQEIARKEGISVESVVVGEDVSLAHNESESKSGRRGMCGLILVLKVAGYLTNGGANLRKIMTESKAVADNMASMGICLESCSVPGSGKLFDLEADETELGTGVHGEAGVKKMKLKSAAETVKTLLQPITKQLNLKRNDEVVAIVNNLGALSQSEQWIIAEDLHLQLAENGIALLRMYVGTLFTALNMTGIQICLVKITHELKQWILNALDESTAAPAWPGSILSLPAPEPTSPIAIAKNAPHEFVSFPGCLLSETEVEIVRRCLLDAAMVLIENEDRLNYLDGGCGDGDCGTTLSRFAKAILKAAQQEVLNFSCPGHLTAQLCHIAEENAGGTTGAIYGLFLTGASCELAKYPSEINSVIWGRAWRAGVEFIKKYSAARMGDRTLLDALEPSCDTFIDMIQSSKCTKSWKEAFEAAVVTAKSECAKTQYMTARIGRASYVNESKLKEMDAGAFGITLWLATFNNVLNNYFP